MVAAHHVEQYRRFRFAIWAVERDVVVNAEVGNLPANLQHGGDADLEDHALLSEMECHNYSDVVIKIRKL